MDCAELKDWLSAEFDDEIDPGRRRELQAHCLACAGCRDERERYRSLLGEVGPLMHRLVDRELPAAPFPEAPERSWRRWLPSGPALGFSAASGAALALLVLAIGRIRVDPPAPPPGGGRPAITAAARGMVHDPDCPWRRSTPQELARTVSYPVVADDCLDHQFELIEASVAHGHSCPENVRLTYRAGDRRVVLEQHLESQPTDCRLGEPVLIGRFAGCFERLPRGGGQLRWNHRDRAFALSGDVAAAEALVMADDIARSLED